MTRVIVDRASLLLDLYTYTCILRHDKSWCLRFITVSLFSLSFFFFFLEFQVSVQAPVLEALNLSD